MRSEGEAMVCAIDEPTPCPSTPSWTLTLGHRGGKRLPCARYHPHLLSPQLRQVMQPSIMITALVLHLVQSWAFSG